MAFASLRSEAGFSLIELILVIVILSAVVGGTFYVTSADREHRLDLAAQELAAAIRFAQSESIRTEIPHGINIDLINHQSRVYWPDTSGPLPVPTYDVLHPLTKNLYTQKFNSDSIFSGITISGVGFFFRGRAMASNSLEFDQWGTPRLNDYMIIRLLSSGEIRLAYDGGERIITVTPMNGRVTVQ